MVKAANASEEIHKCERLRTHRASLTTRSDNTSGPQKSDEAAIGNLDAMTCNETSGDRLDHERAVEYGRLPVVVLGLSVRPSNCLQRAGIKTIEDLLSYKPADLMDLQHFGVTSLDEIEEKLEEQGLALATAANQKQRQSAAAQPIAQGGTSEVDELSPLEDRFPLRRRSFNALERAGISTVEELAAMSKEELLALPNFGLTSLDDVTKCLEEHGLRLSSKVTPRRRQRSLTSSVKETLWPMFEEGLKIAQVAKRTGLSKSDVSSAQRAWFQERERKMVELREAEWTFEEIGDQIGLTRERVRQILNKAGAVSAQELRKRARLKREEEAESAAAAMRAQVRANPGTTLEVVAEQLGVDLATVRRALTTAEMKLIVEADGRSAPDASKKWSRQELLDLLKVVATYSWPITVNSYDALLEVGEIDGPTSQLFGLRFGSWSAACAAAGVESGTAWRAEYNRAWTEEDLWRYVCDYLLDPATKGTYQGMDLWLAGKEDAPSGATIRSRLGTWNTMKAGAIKQLVASGELKEHGLID